MTAGLVRVDFLGLLPGGDEFMNRFYWDTGSTDIDDDLLEAIADNAVDGLINVATELQDFYRANTVWSPAKATWIDPATNTTISDAYGTATGAGVRVGGQSMPNQLCAVTTFRTGTDSGSTRGRTYLPAPCSVAYTDAGRFTADFIDAALASWASVLDAIRTNVTGMDSGPSQYSEKNHAQAVVTAIEVGDVPDTQRRRTNAMSEARSALTVPPW